MPIHNRIVVPIYSDSGHYVDIVTGVVTAVRLVKMSDRRVMVQHWTNNKLTDAVMVYADVLIEWLKE